MAAAVGKDDPYSLIQTSCKLVQNLFKLSGFGLYISIKSKPAENTVGDACIKCRRHIINTYNIYKCIYLIIYKFEIKSVIIIPAGWLTDVRIRPFDRFFDTSSKAVEMSCSNAWFRLFTGGRFNVNVAIPVLSFTDRLTRLLVAETAWPRMNGAVPPDAMFKRPLLPNWDVTLRIISHSVSNWFCLRDENGG